MFVLPYFRELKSSTVDPFVTAGPPSFFITIVHYKMLFKVISLETFDKMEVNELFCQRSAKDDYSALRFSCVICIFIIYNALKRHVSLVRCMYAMIV